MFFISCYYNLKIVLFPQQFYNQYNYWVPTILQPIQLLSSRSEKNVAPQYLIWRTSFLIISASFWAEIHCLRNIWKNTNWGFEEHSTLFPGLIIIISYLRTKEFAFDQLFCLIHYLLKNLMGICIDWSLSQLDMTDFQSFNIFF